MGLSQNRQRIIKRADFWAGPSGKWRPRVIQMIHYFQKAGAEVAPTRKEAEEALTRRSTGVKIRGEVKHWCGIFNCCVIREAGLTKPRWTLYGGKIKNLKLMWGTQGLQPGDIAIFKGGRHHHAIIKEIDEEEKTLTVIEGNTFGQWIKRSKKNLNMAYAYYQIPDDD